MYLRVFIIFGFAGITLSGCTASTIQVELGQLSEGQVDFERTTVPEENIIKEITLPAKASILVPFTVQAPLGDWGAPYQEACEEASIIMMDYYLRNAPLEPEQANREIVQLVQWEEANFYKYDVSLLDVKTIVGEYYKYPTRIVEEVTKESIMYEIANGNPVVVPVAGRKLNNPYFSGDGPWYHMLVITGYDGKYFITNDPGTRHGLDYKYRMDILVDAIHDWTGVKEDIESGQKRMLIIGKNL